MIDATKIKPYRIKRRFWRFVARSYQVIRKKGRPQVRLEICEVWSGIATLIILLGILLEFDSAIASSGPNSLIALGLAIEFFCIVRTTAAAREYQIESDKKLAATRLEAARAHERAASAELALQKLKADRELDLAIFREKLAGKSKLPVEILYIDGGDCPFLAAEISRALAIADWEGVQVKCIREKNPAPQYSRYDWPLAVTYGGFPSRVSVVGSVWTEVGATADEDPVTYALREALETALGEEVRFGFQDRSMKPGTVRIVVAPRA